MPPTQPPPDIDRYGRVRTPGGLLVPESVRLPAAASMGALLSELDTLGSSVIAGGFSAGTPLPRDPQTLAVRFPRKGSVLSDRIMAAIVDGDVANVGVSPVVAPEISAVMRRQQNQAMTASVDVSGRQTPMRKARDAIARFNDSPLGITDALQRIVYGVCAYNRGAPIATVPLMTAFEDWEANGLHAVPILGAGQTAESATRYYLTVDWSAVGTPIPYLPDVFDLEPTGVTEYPYWYRVRKGDTFVWVLLHSSHIIPITPGVSAMPGIGTSPVWLCMGVFAEQILILEERAEKLLYTLSDSIVLIGGVKMNGDYLDKKLSEGREAALDRGFRVAKPPTVITSELDKVSYVQINFRQPNGVEFEKWRMYVEDRVALIFNEALTALVTRGGVGYGAQSDAVADNTAETGVGAILMRLENVLGALYPRVLITVSRPNDRAQRQNIATLKTFSEAITPLLDRGVVTPAEARLMVDRDILYLPTADTATTSANSSDDSEDTGSSGADDTTTESLEARLRGDLDRVRQLAADDLLYADEAVQITDADVDVALAKARRRINNDLYQLLTAEPVED